MSPYLEFISWLSGQWWYWAGLLMTCAVIFYFIGRRPNS